MKDYLMMAIIAICIIGIQALIVYWCSCVHWSLGLFATFVIAALDIFALMENDL